MKILVIHNHYRERGGEDAVMEAEVKVLREHGHEVRVYTRTNKEIEGMSFLGKVRLALVDALGSKNTAMEIRNILSEFKPDVAHKKCNLDKLTSISVYDSIIFIY